MRNTITVIICICFIFVHNININIFHNYDFNCDSKEDVFDIVYLKTAQKSRATNNMYILNNMDLNHDFVLNDKDVQIYKAILLNK